MLAASVLDERSAIANAPGNITSKVPRCCSLGGKAKTRSHLRTEVKEKCGWQNSACRDLHNIKLNLDYKDLSPTSIGSTTVERYPPQGFCTIETPLDPFGFPVIDYS